MTHWSPSKSGSGFVVVNFLLGLLYLCGNTASQAAGGEIDATVTSLHLLDDTAKVVALVEVGGALATPFGQRNMQATIASPQGQQFLAVAMLFQAKYGVDVMRDVSRLVVIAPFTDGEPFADLLFAVDAKLNKRQLEHALIFADKCPAEEHNGCLIFEVNNGSGKFYCSTLTDSLFVAAIEKKPIVNAIDRAAENEQTASKRIAEAINALPKTHLAWAVADTSAFKRKEADWVSFRENTEWFSVGLAAVGQTARLDATFEAPSVEAATSLELLIGKYLNRNQQGDPIFALIPQRFQPEGDSITIRRNGTRLHLMAAGL